MTNACNYPWREDKGSCGYCGSMTPAEAIKRMLVPGTSYSGADWKYGFPHKFYIGSNYPHKFYSAHLKDATPEQFAEFNEISEKYFGVSWLIEDGQLKYKAVPNTQRCGAIPPSSKKEAA